MNPLLVAIEESPLVSATSSTCFVEVIDNTVEAAGSNIVLVVKVIAGVVGVISAVETMVVVVKILMACAQRRKVGYGYLYENF